MQGVWRELRGSQVLEEAGNMQAERCGGVERAVEMPDSGGGDIIARLALGPMAHDSRG